MKRDPRAPTELTAPTTASTKDDYAGFAFGGTAAGPNICACSSCLYDARRTARRKHILGKPRGLVVVDGVAFAVVERGANGPVFMIHAGSADVVLATHFAPVGQA